jgi:hypothetical protein
VRAAVCYEGESRDRKERGDTNSMLFYVYRSTVKATSQGLDQIACIRGI